MRVLVVFHGWLPSARRPGSGGAIRAWHHIEALREAGHEVLLVTRAQDAWDGGPPVYASASELRAYAKAVAPDRILCVQPEEAPALADLGVPLCVDLYAPRLLESAWQLPQEHADAAVQTLQALAAADEVLFSNPRQRWFYLGLLALAGWNLREDSGRVVPLVAPQGPERTPPDSPRIVMGGVAWPWQDPTDALARAKKHLNKRRRGQLVVYGGRSVVGESGVVDLASAVKPGKRLTYIGNLEYPDLLAAYAGATAALDVMAPNPERELAVAFRHMDYLGCGLPMITSGHGLDLGDAAWVVGDLEAALDQVLDDADLVARKSKAAIALAAEYARDRCEVALLDWVADGTTRDRESTSLLSSADARADLGRAEGALLAERELRHKAEAEVTDKRAENERLSAQISTLTGTIERLTRTLDEVAGFKREAVRVLGAGQTAASEEAKALSRELADMRADLAKKDTELRASQRDIDRLNDVVTSIKDQASYAGERLIEAGQRENKLRTDRDSWKNRAERGLLARILRRD
ncbi:MAG: hypothetical protein GY913_11780 [Proteobacteria bacterium]|nr:hypothetical protein [Pseudomonadota bacterium]MCP4917594.1 hypothetical protein [Pseudomonadota bacterium]